MRNPKPYVILLLLFVISSAKTQGQTLSNQQRKRIALNDSIIDLGALPLIPSTLRVILPTGDTLTHPSFQLDSTQTKLQLGEIAPTQDSATLLYRVFPFPLLQCFSPHTAHSGKLLWQRVGGVHPQAPKSPRKPPLKLEGYFNRQMGAGQVTQGGSSGSMDLRLSGQLPNGMRIEGHIVDHALPFQPAGTSAELSQIERVFLRVADSSWYAEAGDLSMHKSRGGLLAYDHAIQGIGAGGMASNRQYEGQISLGLARGATRSTTLKAREGVQGPYRLEGERQYLQIVILAGTERVYLDGKPLTRGRRGDYTIDYNLGEISFTPRCPIRGTSRIRVIYQTMDQPYPKMLAQGNIQAELNEQWNYHLRSYLAHDVAKKTTPSLPDSTGRHTRSSPNTHSVLENTLSHQSRESSTCLRIAYSYRHQQPPEVTEGGRTHGFASELHHDQRLLRYGSDGLRLIARGRYIGLGYQSPQDFLPLDFYHQWGLNAIADSSVWGDGVLGLRSTTRLGLAEVLADLLLREQTQGYGLHESASLQLWNHYRVQGKGFHRWLSQDGKPIQTQQGEVKTSRQFGKLTIGILAAAELRASPHADTLSPSEDYCWWQTGIESQYRDSGQYHWSARVLFHDNRKIAQQRYSPIRQSLQAHSEGSHLWAQGAALHYLLNLSIPFSLRVPGKPRDWLSSLGQISAELPLWQKRIQIRMETELSSEFTTRMEHHYIPVPTGEGQYQWIDGNGDGTKQLEEFVRALYPDQANYVLQMVPTSNEKRTLSRRQGASLYLSPRPKHAPITPRTPWYYRWDWQVRGDAKIQQATQGWKDRLSIPSRLSDSSLVEAHATLLSEFYYNRDAEPLGVVYSYRHSLGKAPLPQGVEYNTNQAHRLSLLSPTRPGPGFQLDGEYEQIQRDIPYGSQDALDFPRWQGKLSGLWRGLGAHAHTLYYRYAGLQPKSREYTQMHELGYITELPIGRRWEGNAHLQFVHVMGEKSFFRNPLAYTYVEGMGLGNNYLIALSLSYRISRYLRAALSYSLRRLGDAPTRHSGFLRLSARFQ